MIVIILYSLLIMIVSLVGVFTIWQRIGTVIERNLSLLVSFSAGVILAIAYELGKEVVEHSSTPGLGFMWIVAGMLIVWLLFKLFPASHHHHDENFESEMHSGLDARKILLSDALHNMGDGILLASSFAISSSLGMLTALSIFIHELAQETSEFFVLRQAGYSIKKALVLNFIISSTILIGALGGYFLLETFEILETPLLGLASGAFLIVVLYDLIPHSVAVSRYKNIYLKHILLFVVGALLMFGISMFTGH